MKKTLAGHLGFMCVYNTYFYQNPAYNFALCIFLVLLFKLTSGHLCMHQEEMMRPETRNRTVWFASSYELLLRRSIDCCIATAAVFARNHQALLFWCFHGKLVTHGSRPQHAGCS